MNPRSLLLRRTKTAACRPRRQPTYLAYAPATHSHKRCSIQWRQAQPAISPTTAISAFGCKQYCTCELAHDSIDPLYTCSMTTLLDTARTMELLAYLGFNVAYGSQLAALTVTRDKRIDWQTRSTQRQTFHAHVIGPKDAGKVSACLRSPLSIRTTGLTAIRTCTRRLPCFKASSGGH